MHFAVFRVLLRIGQLHKSQTDNGANEMIDRRRFVFSATASALGFLAIGKTPKAMADDVEVRAKGMFTGRSGHVSSGAARVIVENDRIFVELGDDFRLDSAPDPRVAFGRDGQYDRTSYLGALQNLHGKQRYAVPVTWKISNYDSVYLWCELANVPLAVAPFE